MKVLLALPAAFMVAACAGQPAADVWGDYSLMGRAASGVIWDERAPASLYQWDTVSANEAHIHWGSPKNWPTEHRERFIHSGDWVLLDGWWGNGTYYTQRVTKEMLCDAACNSCKPLEGDVQHYAMWRVPAHAYCLQAEGTITERSSGKVLHFKHVQVYTPPAPCSNTSFAHATCITQHETWWDDNRTQFEKKLDRTEYLGKGLGHGFRIDQTFPKPWHAELHEVPKQ
ncbi:MAG TPA: hypothetical protein VMZ74_05375 [Ramlibacter sp.]|nr:hypothetical protein [Ramlibacter sp.]